MVKRAHMILVPDKGIGKVRTFRVNPWLVRCLALLIFLCVCALPFLEVEIISLVKKVQHLEETRTALESEIATLEYLKVSLNRFEEKERILRDYFGMEEHPSLGRVVGIGGVSTLEDSNSAMRTSTSRKGSSERSHSRVSYEPPVELQEKIEVLASNFDILNRLTAKQEEIWDRTPSIFPVAISHPKISSEFGWRKNPFTERREFHAGIDILGPKGTKIIAPASGAVVEKGYDRWLGHFLVLDHGKGLKTIYGHMESVTVDQGMRVKRGDLLGRMGNTGLSTSRHLHYAVIVGGRVVDPRQFILEKGNS